MKDQKIKDNVYEILEKNYEKGVAVLVSGYRWGTGPNDIVVNDFFVDINLQGENYILRSGKYVLEVRPDNSIYDNYAPISFQTYQLKYTLSDERVLFDEGVTFSSGKYIVGGDPVYGATYSQYSTNSCMFELPDIDISLFDNSDTYFFSTPLLPGNVSFEEKSFSVKNYSLVFYGNGQGEYTLDRLYCETDDDEAIPETGTIELKILKLL